MGKINVRLFKLFLGLCLCWNWNCIGAECANPVAPIKQGQAASCDGYLFSPDAEETAYKAKRAAELYKSENEILEQRLKLYMDATTSLSKEVASRDNNESLYRILAFGLGAALTGYLAVNVPR